MDGHKVGARVGEGAAASVGLERSSISAIQPCLLMIFSLSIQADFNLAPSNLSGLLKLR
jgi:hypothetical protein